VEVGGIALDRGAALVGRVGEAIGHLAGLLEACIVEVGMEVGLVVAHGSTLAAMARRNRKTQRMRRLSRIFRTQIFMIYDTKSCHPSRTVRQCLMDG